MSQNSLKYTSSHLVFTANGFVTIPGALQLASQVHPHKLKCNRRLKPQTMACSTPAFCDSYCTPYYDHFLLQVGFDISVLWINITTAPNPWHPSSFQASDTSVWVWSAGFLSTPQWAPSALWWNSSNILLASCAVNTALARWCSCTSHFLWQW